MPPPAKTLEFRFSVNNSWFLLSMTSLVASLSTAQTTFAQQKRANPTSEDSPSTSRQEMTRSRKAASIRTHSNGETKTVSAQQQSAISVSSGFYFPLTRPTASIAFSTLFRKTELSLRIGGSFASVSKSFQDAAASNQTYSQKLSDADAYVWDADVAAPELTILLPANFFVAGTSFGRFTRCVSNYTSNTGSPLRFSGWAVAIGTGGRGGYRLPLAGDDFFLEFYGGLTWPLWSTGFSDISYTPLDASATQTFSDDDLATILDSLQVYLKALSYQVTTEAGIRAAWRF